MTSLLIRPDPEHNPSLYPEWGSGKEFKSDPGNLWTPRTPTWQYSGHPIKQHYDLTALKRSNVRLNDQLLPTPQTSVMHEKTIKLPFPAEHPYTSHIERKAVFPKFDSPDDPDRGVAARRDMPKHPEMPAKNYDIIVVRKVKGNPYREEIQALPPESQKPALEWHEHRFDQEVKGPGESHAEYYPWPPKALVPNLEQRDESMVARGDMTISKRSANALRNVERDQWTTTYDRSHTGLGPTNAYDLDNLGQAMDPLNPSKSLTARSSRTFDPPRPFEGRIARLMTPAPQPDPNFPPPPKNTNYTPRKTLSEIEEERMWNGTEYKSYPGPQEDTYPQYPSPRPPPEIPQDDTPQPLTADEKLQEELAKAALKKHHHFQQVEASNRWKELELQTPDHDMTALNNKLALTNIKAQPKVFHDHENQYREERAGLYKTSYDPPKPPIKSSEIFDTSNSHKDVLNRDLDLNQDMHMDMQFGRTLGGNGSVPQLNSQPSQYELLEPFNIAKTLQRAKLQPTKPDFKVQEGHVNLTDSSYGKDFNVPRFLQEREMPSYTRQAPTVLMSEENQLLENCRMVSQPAIPPLPVDMHLPVKPASLVTGEAVDISRPRTAPDGHFLPQFSKRYSYQQPEIQTARASGPPTTSKTSSLTRSQSLYDSGTSSARYTSRSLDMSYKDDEFFNWKVTSGYPRPQSRLLDIQNSFTKTQAKRDFLARFPERNPDLRENITRGKKHDFDGFNAQILRGTPVEGVA